MYSAHLMPPFCRFFYPKQRAIGLTTRHKKIEQKYSIDQTGGRPAGHLFHDLFVAQSAFERFDLLLLRLTAESGGVAATSPSTAMAPAAPVLGRTAAAAVVVEAGTVEASALSLPPLPLPLLLVMLRPSAAPSPPSPFPDDEIVELLAELVDARHVDAVDPALVKEDQENNVVAEAERRCIQGILMTKANRSSMNVLRDL